MKTLRSKLLLAMLSIALIITVLLSLVSVYFINVSAKDTLKSTAEPLAVQAAKNFDSTISSYTNNIVSTVKSDSFSEAKTDADRLKAIKSGFADNTGFYLNFTIFDGNGIVLATDNEMVSSSVEKEHIISACERSSAYITDIYTFGGKNYFSILASTKSGNTEQKVACITIQSDMLINALNEYTFGKSGYVYLVGKDGEILLHKDTDQIGKNALEIGKKDEEYTEVTNAVEKILANNSGTTEYKFKDNNYIVGYYGSSYFDGTVVMVTNVADFTTASSSALTNIIVMGVVLMCLTVLFSLLFAKRITKPIISTTNRLRSLAQGNLTDPVDVWYSKDELGVLSNSLEETIVCLRQYINLITVALTQISEGNLCHRMEGTFKGDFYKIKSTFNEILDSLSDTFASINMSAEHSLYHRVLHSRLPRSRSFPLPSVMFQSR